MTEAADLPGLLERAEALAGRRPRPGDPRRAGRAGRAPRGTVTTARGAELQDRFCGLLEFGTAGLRGALGAGPNRMNRSVVIRAAAGLTAYLQARGHAPGVVIGYDARHGSDDFARDTAAVVTAAGGSAMVLPHPLPTPVLAFAIRHLGCDAGVMVTASHNPPQDNGYKVYLGDGSQIVPPADAGIAAAIAAVRAHRRTSPLADDGWVTLDDEPLLAYLDARRRRARTGHAARPVDRAHAPARRRPRRARRRTGRAPASRRRTSLPRKAIRTPTSRPWPSPTRRSRERSTRPWTPRAAQGADIVLANDPDADRCAVAVPDAGADGGWRMLRGDEVGVLLGAHLIERGVPDGAVFASSIVSSRWLGGGLRRGRHRPRGDADRVQVDRPRARACATATRRRSATASTRPTCGTRTGCPRPC